MSGAGAPTAALIGGVMLATVAWPSRAPIRAYADLPGHRAIAAFTGMTVAGTDVAIRKYKGYSYSRLAAGTAATAVVTAAEEVASCVVRPKNWR